MRTYLLLAILLIPGFAPAQAVNNNINTTKNKEDKMQSNKEIVRKVYEQALNKRNMALLQELISTDFTGFQGLKGPAGFEAPVMPLINAIPDAQWDIQELIGEGNKVIVTWQMQGTFTRQFQYIPPTGKKVTNTGMGIYELKDGKITGAQIQTDRLGFLQEAGVLPSDPARLSAKKAHKDLVSFIDKFSVPAAARKEFYERMNINRNFIKALPGFIEDAAYEYTDNNGNLICVTIALWENKAAFEKAREAVQAEYKKQGFDPSAMFTRLHITADRGIYAVADAQ